MSSMSIFSKMKMILCFSLLLIQLCSGNRNLTHNPRAIKPKIEELTNYNFDYSAHKAPLAYQTYGTSVELFHRLKLISGVPDKYGQVALKRVSSDFS